MAYIKSSSTSSSSSYSNNFSFSSFTPRNALLTNTLYDDLDVSVDEKNEKTSVSASPWSSARARILAPPIIRHKDLSISQQHLKKTVANKISNENSSSEPLGLNTTLEESNVGNMHNATCVRNSSSNSCASNIISSNSVSNDNKITNLISSLSNIKNNIINSISNANIPLVESVGAALINPGTGRANLIGEGRGGGSIAHTWGGGAGGNATLTSGASSNVNPALSLLNVSNRIHDKELYNPSKPNDYEMIVRERNKQKQIDEMNKHRIEEMERIRKERESLLGHSGSALYDESSKRRAMVGESCNASSYSLHASASNNDENDYKKVSFAARLMEKMGWKEGEGLGREKQGIVAPLVAKKTDKRSGVIIQGGNIKADRNSGGLINSSTESSFLHQNNIFAQNVNVNNNPLLAESRVILLTNMVDRGEVDEDLQEEVEDEAGKFGNLLKVKIIEKPQNYKQQNDKDLVRIFLLYETLEDSKKAFCAMNGRKFGGRVVKAKFFNETKFKNNELLD